MSETLFSGFPDISAQQWKQQIQYELKGSDYNELVWESPEGIKVKPFYHRDDVEVPMPAGNPQHFAICQEIFVFDVGKSANRAAESVMRGAEEIRFILPQEVDLSELLGQLPDDIPVFLEPQFLSADYFLKYRELLQSRTVYLLLDPIRQFATDGNWFNGGDNLQVLKSLSDAGFASFSADGKPYQNAGANMVQQIAYAMAHATEVLQACGGSGKSFVLQVAVGSNYFFEIAKLRAIRLLFHSIADAFGHTGGCRILAVPSKRNKTIYDYNVNMLRTTTECMSAVLGGADSVQNLPYDALYHKSNEFGERIARNQLLILKNESYFDKTANAADGSYYIESITGELADKALVLFKDIEASGGLLKQMKEGTIQRKIAESAEKEQARFDAGQEILIGTNKYPNKADRMKDDLELYPFVKIKPRKTLVTPIIAKRLSESLEQDRLNTENE